VPAGVEFVDIAALAKGASTGEGLGNRFLGSLREVDALVYVLRAFEDQSVMTATGGHPDPADDLATLEFELVLADLAAVQGGSPAGEGGPGRQVHPPEIAALERAQTFLDEGTPIYRAGMSADERDLLKASFLLTTKPILIVVNIGEDQLEEAAKLAGPFGEDALAVSVQLESEAARLDPEERSELLEGLGLGDGVVPRVARAAYHLLGRRTFLTPGR